MCDRGGGVYGDRGQLECGVRVGWGWEGGQGVEEEDRSYR